MSSATKALWTIETGVILEQPIDKLTVTFVYTAEDYEHDMEEVSREKTRFAHYQHQVKELLEEYSNPALHNWVRVNFIWM